MQKLFTEFNDTTAQQWKEQLVKDLKGIDFDALVSATNEGIDKHPFYTADAISKKQEPIFTHNDWAICERIVVEDEKHANQQALNALSNGVSGLEFIITNKTNYAVLLNGILLEHIYSLFHIQSENLLELQSTLKSINTGDNCFINTDIISALCQTGNWITSQEQDFTIITNLSTLFINGTVYQESGANAVNELSFIVSHLNEYLNHYAQEKRLSQLKKIHITISVGADFFKEIAKLRALRQLTYFICEQYKLVVPIHIHGQTTSINKSHLDSYTNLLRSTTEAMSASIGGCNSLTVFPFDNSFTEPNSFSLRMARNQQLILKEESYLNKVADMAVGSYYIESFTESLCHTSWEAFKLIENKGGFIENLKQNTIQSIIKKDVELLKQQFADGSLVLVGVNKFKNQNETITVASAKANKLHENTSIEPIYKIKLGDEIIHL